VSGIVQQQQLILRTNMQKGKVVLYLRFLYPKITPSMYGKAIKNLFFDII